MTKTLKAAVAALLAAAALGLAGCAPLAPAEPAATVVASDPWVKAVPADAMMTGAFMTLTNTTDSDVTVEGALSALPGMVELHEMAMVDGDMIMREAESPIVIPAGGSFEFAPGGYHFMFMGLDEAIEPGTVVELIISLSDGTDVTVDLVAREFDAANETYVGDDGTDQ